MGSKTEIALQNAALHLLGDRHYLDVTVTDLVREAKVSRASFYRHYNSFDDVVTAYIKSRGANMMSKLLPILLSGDKEHIINALTEIYSVVETKEDPIINSLPENRPYLQNKINVGPHLLGRSGDLPIDKAFGPFVGYSTIVDIAVAWKKGGFVYPAREVAEYTYWYIWRK